MAIDSSGNWWKGNVLLGNVGNLYGDIFGREGSQEEIDYWNNQLTSGNKTFAEIQSDFVASPEYQNIASNSTKPFTWGDHDNDPATQPTLINNPNSAIKWDHNYNGVEGVSQVYGDGFDSFLAGTPNNQTQAGGAATPAAGGQQQDPLGATTNQPDWSALMGGFNSLFDRQSSMFGDMFNQQSNAFNDTLSSFSDMFTKQNEAQDAAQNTWKNDWNQSSTLPFQYQSNLGSTKNSKSWFNNNPFNMSTF